MILPLSATMKGSENERGEKRSRHFKDIFAERCKLQHEVGALE